MSFLDNFSFQVHGQKQLSKLVFLHGVMGSGANWRRIVPAFVDRYEVLTFDQRGHGGSFHPSEGYAPEDYAEDLRKILDELGWQKIFLVGHSMGGRNALHFAYQFPRRVRGLVIEDIPPSRDKNAGAHTEELLREIPVPFANRRAAKEYFLNDFVVRFSNRRQVHQLGQFLYSNIVEDQQGRGVWRFYQPGVMESIDESRTHDRWGELEKLAVPTLIIRGAFSDELSGKDYKRMLSVSPFIHGVEIPGASHWVHTDQPEAFIAAVDHFFAQIQTLA